MENMQFTDVKKTHPIDLIKRGIEQLKFYQRCDDEYPANVTFEIFETDDDIIYYTIDRPDTTYRLSLNFKGGCSLSGKSKNKLDLDQLFEEIEKLDIIKLRKIKFNEPRKYHSYFDYIISGGTK